MDPLLEARVNRLVEWAKGNPAPPVSIELVPTERCNLNCKSCWRQGWDKESLEKRYATEMDDERLLKLIDEAAEIGVKEIAYVGGGEPLIRDVTIKLMKRQKAYGMEGDLVTNGTLLTKDVAETLVRIGWDRVKVSIDGPNAEIHDELRGVKGTFKKATTNIENLSKIKKAYKSSKPRILFNTVVSTINYKLLPEMVRLAARIGVDEILLLPVTIFDESAKDLKLNPEQTLELIKILKNCIELAKKLNVQNNFSEFLDPKYIEKTEAMHEVMMEEVEKDKKLKILIKKHYPAYKDKIKDFLFMPCYMPWHHITVLPNGSIAPCFSPWAWETKVSLKNHNLKELWYGKYFEKFRKIIKSRKLPESCRTCCVWRVFENRRIRDYIKSHLEGG
ncbi:MAG: radical SAM protein [Candidatus Aenigmarchaeota archaeon]|nr:radical SAM protein [Candidatus Aenigmarchaeota archaeon]